MKAIHLLLITCLAVVGLQAQSEETLFSNTRFDITGAWGSAAYNYTGFSDDWALIRGGYGAIELNRDVLVGWGGYKTREAAVTESGNQEFDLHYRGLMLGFMPNSYRAIHPRFTFLTGSGRVWTPEDGDKNRVFVFQPAAGIEFNVFQWFRVGLEAGYRFAGASRQHNLTSSDTSAPFAQIELRFGLSWGD